MEKRHVIHPFTPIVSQSSTVLILGSIPSPVSCEKGFYYMHPRNRFWRVIEYVTDKEFVRKSTEEKIRTLHECGIGLYDVIAECDMTDASDASVKNVRYADVYSLLKESSVKLIALNGKRAAKEFKKAFPELSEMSVTLPSTSPANAAFTIEMLCSIWKDAVSGYLNQ